MAVVCYASDITEYDGRTPELSDAPLYMKQDPSSIAASQASIGPV